MQAKPQKFLWFFYYKLAYVNIDIEFMFIDYFYWHYTTAPKEIVKLSRNYAIGIWHKFLVLQHLKTLFSPWHRMRPGEVLIPKNWGDKVGNFIVDVYTRLLAALVRLSIVVLGLAAEIIVFAFFVGLLAAWIFWPFIFLFSISKGFLLLF